MEVIITMNNTTYSPKAGEIEKKWYIIDAADKSLGRVATEAAKLLRGKHKPTYTPNQDTGDYVIVINCKDAVLTGHKLDQKVYQRRYRRGDRCSQPRKIYFSEQPRVSGKRI